MLYWLARISQNGTSSAFVLSFLNRDPLLTIHSPDQEHAARWKQYKSWTFPVTMLWNPQDRVECSTIHRCLIMIWRTCFWIRICTLTLPTSVTQCFHTMSEAVMQCFYTLPTLWAFLLRLAMSLEVVRKFGGRHLSATIWLLQVWTSFHWAKIFLLAVTLFQEKQPHLLVSGSRSHQYLHLARPSIGTLVRFLLCTGKFSEKHQTNLFITF
jgi:hypothetical protein